MCSLESCIHVESCQTAAAAAWTEPNWTAQASTEHHYHHHHHQIDDECGGNYSSLSAKPFTRSLGRSSCLWWYNQNLKLHAIESAGWKVGDNSEFDCLAVEFIPFCRDSLNEFHSQAAPRKSFLFIIALDGTHWLADSNVVVVVGEKRKFFKWQLESSFYIFKLYFFVQSRTIEQRSHPASQLVRAECRWLFIYTFGSSKR